MKQIVTLELEVNIEGDRTNGNEVFAAVTEGMRECGERLGKAVLERYQERLVEILSSPSGRVAKKGLGGHEVKGDPTRRCRHRSFKRAGHWNREKVLRGEHFTVGFRPAMVECKGCGKRITPILDGLELEEYQRRLDGLLRKTMEAVAETSYRRGSVQLDVLGEVPVAKSTAHRWAAEVAFPVQESTGKPFLGADGTGFKKQPGQRGDVRYVMEWDDEGNLKPLGVWAGKSWEEIRSEVEDRLRGQPSLFMSDGEKGLQEWLGGLAAKAGRCHWHFFHDSGYGLWEDGVPLGERKKIKESLRRLLAIEIPEEDVEPVSDEEKAELRDRIKKAEDELEELRQEFTEKGYKKAATYLANARERLFKHLELWLETGIVAPRSASILECIIRELVRRLKKAGWNWSDEGATRMGRMVMIRRYDPEAWEAYWKKRMNLQGRCKIKVLRCEVTRAA